MAKDLERAVRKGSRLDEDGAAGLQRRLGRGGGGHGFRGGPVLKGCPAPSESGGPVEVAQDVDPVIPEWQGISRPRELGKAATRLFWDVYPCLRVGVILMCITVASASRRDVVQRDYP